MSNQQSKTKPTKSPDQVRQEFTEAGISYSEWARAHGVSRSLVSMVLSGKRRALRGASHKVAVLLGLKAGRVGVSPQDMVSDLSRRPR